MSEVQIPNEIEQKIKEAIKEGEYFITITKKIAGENLDLKHYWNAKSISNEDVLQSIDEITKDYKNKNKRKS